MRRIMMKSMRSVAPFVVGTMAATVFPFRGAAKPLTPDSPDGANWRVEQFAEADGRQGAIVFSRQDASAEATVPLHLEGLRPEGIYLFTDKETGHEAVWNGAVVRDIGLRVTVTEKGREKRLSYRHLDDLGNDLRSTGKMTLSGADAEADPCRPFPVLRHVPDRLNDENRSFQACPSVTVSPGGRLWAAFVTGDSTEGEDNINMVVSSGDGGRTWSRPLFAIDGPGPTRTMDVGLWTDPQGRVWFFYCQLFGFWDGRAGLWVMRALDPEDPNTAWTPAHRLCDGYLKNKPTVLKDGRILLPVEFFEPYFTGFAGRIGAFVTMPSERMFDCSPYNHYNAFLADSELREAHFLGRSRCPRQGYAFPENMIVERRDGSLWMLMRTSFDRLGEAFSTDGGKTWTDRSLSGIPHPSSRFFIRRLRSGALLLVKNGDMKVADARNRICAFVSDDDGRTWLGGLVLDGRDGVSYPDADQAADGTIFVVNDHDRSGEADIVCHRFSEADVRAGRLVTPESRLGQLVSKAGAKGVR